MQNDVYLCQDRKRKQIVYEIIKILSANQKPNLIALQSILSITYTHICAYN